MAACVWHLRSPTLLPLLTLLTQAALGKAASAPHQAVLVGTSRFWFNYRHTANTLGVYHHVKR